MRIISGECRGRKLNPIQGQDIRPTSDRVREALFNIIGPAIRGQRVLDLFAGTGAFGLEALSRGACETVFVEMAKQSCDVIQKNIEMCRMTDKSHLVVHDLVNSPLPEGLGQFDLIFMDPPYARGYVGLVLEKPGFTDLMTRDTIIIVEQSARETLVSPPNSLDIYRQKKYSKTFVSFLRFA
ncbi:MAG TPA: 16S rRNA (guanine(966)-N(2))-methyltransferase RsmD [Desulfobacteraceae bacterium]|nr:16S rRNA (guanine(966)-N(2))-methyltransferase RsmD [Desulfobacteraceae bacterium]